MNFIKLLCILIFGFWYIINNGTAITMKQFETSLDMMRSVCAPKFPKITKEMFDNLRKGIFTENKDLKCYIKCIAQMTGTITKKGEISIEKTLAQVDIILPPELQDKARDAFNKCHSTQRSYKDTCDKVYYVTKCVRDYDPENFKFP